MQKTAYDMRISDWSSDVCSSDLAFLPRDGRADIGPAGDEMRLDAQRIDRHPARPESFEQPQHAGAVRRAARAPAHEVVIDQFGFGRLGARGVEGEIDRLLRAAHRA